jgi:hypothetical protein
MGPLRSVFNYIGAVWATVIGPFFVLFLVFDLAHTIAGASAWHSMPMAIAVSGIEYILSVGIGVIVLRYLVHQRKSRIVALSLYVPALYVMLWIWSLSLSCSVSNKCM